MVIFRPHRAGMDIAEAMQQAREFNDEAEMKAYIVKVWHEGYGSGTLFTAQDIVVQSEPKMNDDRVGWEDTMYVCVKRMGDVDYIENKRFVYPKTKSQQKNAKIGLFRATINIKI